MPTVPLQSEDFRVVELTVVKKDHACFLIFLSITVHSFFPSEVFRTSTQPWIKRVTMLGALRLSVRGIEAVRISSQIKGLMRKQERW